MNEWDTIERMINTLPQWDVIKWIMGIQEELKCAKEDNLYQLRQNKNLQSKIDKANEYIENYYIFDEQNGEYYQTHNFDKSNAKELHDILKEE